MTRYPLTVLIVLMATLLVAVACGGGSAASPEPTTAPGEDTVQQSVSQTLAAQAVAQTVAAITGATATEPAVVAQADATNTPPNVENNIPASATPPDVGNEVPAEPSTEEAPPPSCMTIGETNIRSGPGTAFAPPVGLLPGGAEFTPISYVPRGFPQGDWLEIQLPNGQIAWITAGTQFVRCSIVPNSLPGPVFIPPTPPPTATPTPIPATATPAPVVAGLPPNVDNDIPGGACERTDNIKTRIEENPNFLYRVYARDDRAGENDGDGIELVRFTIFDQTGEVYRREERTAGFCIFGGGEPICNNWAYNQQGLFTWGSGGSVVSPGTYQVFIEVVSKEPDPATESNVCNWNFDMTISLP